MLKLYTVEKGIQHLNWGNLSDACTSFEFFIFHMQVHLPRFASHWTTSSSAQWSLDKLPSSFVKWHESTMWDIVWILATGAKVLWVC